MFTRLLNCSGGHSEAFFLENRCSNNAVCAIDGDIRLGGAYVVRGLKVVNDGTWNSVKGVWLRCAGTAKAIGRSVRTALEDVSHVDSLTQYL